jgi:hypothetical protein
MKCNRFFPDYCDIKVTSYTKRQLSGISWRGNPTRFTDDQKEKIINGITVYLEELKNIIAKPETLKNI